VRACNLDEILAEDQIDLEESLFPESSYAACLIRSPDWKGGGIMLPKGQDGGRRRFSIAHELGHYHIPSHSGVNGFCSDTDMRARSTDSRQKEWEANDFAAELLMPHALFSADVGKREISAATAMDLASAEMYNVAGELLRDPVAESSRIDPVAHRRGGLRHG
jgi:Zn-dependent peptidase ImmA (M78 family)